MVVPVATAQELAVIEDEKYQQRLNSKNFTCSETIQADENGEQYLLRDCEQRYEPCITESYLSTDEFGNHERKYRCEPNYRVDYYFVMKLPGNGNLADSIHAKALQLESQKASRFDNNQITIENNVDSITVYGSFEYKTQADIESVKTSINQLIIPGQVEYGQMQLYETWHHIKDTREHCNLIENITYGSLDTP